MIARWTILCMAAAGALLGGPVAATYQPDVMIRGQGETFWRGEGIYVTTRLNQSKVRSVRSGTTAVYELRIRNDGTSTDSFLVAGTAGDASWTIKYYDSLEGGNNITNTVTNSGWLTRTIGPTGWESVRVEVTPGPETIAGSEKQVRVFAISHGDSTRSDMVKANTFLAAGNVYYCSPTGNDSNSGDFEHPWASPGYASRRLDPGDTLVILGGRYVIRRFDDDIMDPPSGTAQAHTVIRGEEGNRPVIAGRENLFAAMFLGGASYVTIRNLEITHDSTTAPSLYFRGGIDIAGAPSSDILLQNLYIHHIDEMAVNMQDVDDIQIINCRFEYCGFGAVGGPAGVSGGCRNVYVKGCELSYGGHYYRGGDGSDRPYDRPDGFGIEPSDGPIEIADTNAQHNYGDGLDSKSENTYIHNCIVANNSCDGIKFWADGGRIINCLVYGTGDGVGGGSPWSGIVIGDGSHSGSNFLIENVTVHDNPTRRAYPLYVQYDSSLPLNLTLRNTIVSNGYGLVFFADSVNLTCDHNLLYRPGDPEQVYANGRTYTAAQLSLLGAGNISANPLFVRPAWGTTGDYHLQAGSLAIGAGTSVGAPDIDLEYNPRPGPAGYDMGAYER